MPKSQLVITRTAFLNNSSKYSINDRTSSFTEVTSLLKGKGIDLDHNRFLILQVRNCVTALETTLEARKMTRLRVRLNPLRR